MANPIKDFANAAKKKGGEAIAWVNDNKWHILRTAGYAVVYGLVGYGAGSLYVDASGLRKICSDVAQADAYTTGYKAGLTDGVSALKSGNGQ